MALTPQGIKEAVEDGAVLLIKVESVDFDLAGTRSQRMRATVKVLRKLHGTAGDTLTLAGYADPANSLLKAGHTYLVAALNSPRFAPALELTEAQETAPDDTAAIDAAGAAIAKAAAKP